MLSVITFLLKRIQRQLNGKKSKKHGENNIQKAWDMLENQNQTGTVTQKSIGKKGMY